MALGIFTMCLKTLPIAKLFLKFHFVRSPAALFPGISGSALKAALVTYRSVSISF